MRTHFMANTWSLKSVHPTLFSSPVSWLGEKTLTHCKCKETLKVWKLNMIKGIKGNNNWSVADVIVSIFWIDTVLMWHKKKEKSTVTPSRSGVHLLILNMGSPPGLDFRACWSELPYFIGNLVHISWARSSLTSDSSHGARGTSRKL